MNKDNSIIFNCYRIRRKFSLPLPLTKLPSLGVEVRGFESDYPWQIWALWALEERLFSLALTCTNADDVEVKRLLERDLTALAGWPCFNAQNKPDLPFAHATLTLATAKLSWSFLSSDCKICIDNGLLRAIEQGIALFSDTLDVQQSSEILAKHNPHQHVHNIPLIALSALAMSAEVTHYEKAKALSNCVHAHVIARLELTQNGFTEGISYDGYWLNFALAWLATQSKPIQDSIIQHPAIKTFEQQVVAQSCPGDIARSAELGDIEPEQMTFLWSALVRLQTFKHSHRRAFLLSQLLKKRLRADALLVMEELRAQDQLTVDIEPLLAEASFLKTNTCISLFSGFDNEDLNAVLAYSSSPMNHIQKDNGTLVIGKQQRWWITDPGYQQYLKTAERDYTIGRQAHNFPVVNGYAHADKVPELIQLREDTSHENCDVVVVDLTDCYPKEAGVESVTRTLWRLGNEQVILCDTVLTDESDNTVEYHWHGHADAYWGEIEKAVYLAFEDISDVMTIQTSIGKIGLNHVQRQRGSRGSATLCTLSHSGQKKVQRCWWLFNFRTSLPILLTDDYTANVDGREFDLRSIVRESIAEPKLSVLVRPDGMEAKVKMGDELLGREIQECWTFSLFVDGKLTQSIESNSRTALFNYFPVGLSNSVVIKARSQDSDQADGQCTLTHSQIEKICQKPLVTVASLKDNQLSAYCVLMPGHIEGEVEYAYYLMVNDERHSVVWYSPNETVTFDVSEIESDAQLTVKGFVRSKEEPDRKFSSTSVGLVSTDVNSKSNQESNELNDKELRSIFSGRNIFVLGSGPSASDELSASDHVLVCVNGSVELLSNVREIDVLVINNPTLTGNDDVAKRSRSALRSVKVKTLICITKTDSFTAMQKRLSELGLTWGKAFHMTADFRVQLSERVLMRRIESSQSNHNVASTGVTAILMAYYGGASNVRLSGFDFSGGHFYSESTRRGHTAVDSEVFKRLNLGQKSA